MKLLVVDCGNTNSLFAVVALDLDAAETPYNIIQRWRAQSIPTRTADEYAAWLHSCFQLAGLGLNEIEAFVIASVVPEMVGTLRSIGNRTLACPTSVIGEDIGYGTTQVRIDRPEEAGVDRVLNAIAAYRRLAVSQIIVDFGTATTFDVVGADGAYLGGAITPGIAMSFQSLNKGTAKLPQLGFDAQRFSYPPPVGKNTQDAILGGVFWGYVSMIEGLAERIRTDQGDSHMPLIATGGLAPLFSRHVKGMNSVIDLTIDGIVAVWLEQQKQR